MKKIYLSLSGFFLIASQLIFSNYIEAQTATLKQEWFQANNTVHKILQDTARNRILLGGQFTNFNKPGKSYLMKTNSTTGELDRINPSADMYVYASIEDGFGGYYVCGAFDSFQGMNRSKIAHIDSNGNVSSFQLTGFNGGHISAMYLEGNTLYIAGGFNIIEGQSRAGLAAINSITGSLLPWKPSLDFYNSIGSFYPNFYSLQIIGNKVFLGGNFEGGYDTSSTFINRRALAAFDKQSGALSSWNANIGAGGQVYCLNSWNDSLVVGGSFNAIGGGLRNYLAIVDTMSAGLSPFNVQFNNAVYSIHDNDSTFYVGGIFTEVNLISRTSFAEIQKSSGALTSLSLVLTSQFNTPIVRKIKREGNQLTICGRFNSVNSSPRGSIAKFNITTNTLENYTISATNPELNTFFQVGNDLFLGGDFTNIDPITKSYLGVAALDATTGDTLPFPIVTGSNEIIWDMAIHGDYLYVGGDFNHYQPSTFDLYKNLVRINLLTDSIDYSWKPQPNDAVFAVLADSNHLYVGGLFTQLDANNRNLVAKLNLTNGIVESFQPFNAPVGINDVVYDLEKHGTNLFIGGSFIGLQSLVRENMAVVNSNTGTLLPTIFNTNGFIRTFHQNNNKLYIGGGFTEINGAGRGRGAAIDMNNLTLEAWNPNIQGFAIRAIDFSDTLVFLGGDFNSIGANSSLNFGIVTANQANQFSLNLTVNGVVRAICIHDNKLLLGGQFTSINNINRSRFAAIDINLQCNLPDMATISASALSVCSVQDSVTFTISSGNLNDASSWSWYYGSCSSGALLGTGNSITASPSQFFSSGSIFPIFVRGTGGCVSASNPNCANINVQIIGTTAVLSGNAGICQGESTTLTVSGATSLTWSDGLGSSNVISVSPTQSSNYTVTGMDTAGCNFSTSIYVNVYNLPNIAITTTNADCNASNGTATFANNGDPISNINYNGIDINALAAGNYSVEVTTVFGCSANISFSIANNNAHEVNLNTNDVLCFGETSGSVNANVTGGTPPYSYNWGGANPLALSAGNYNVTVTDASGCIVSEVFEITEPDELELSGNVTNQQVGNDGAIDLSVTGGTPPYNFNWSNGATSQNITDLAPGEYSISITDANNCNLEADFQVLAGPGSIQEFNKQSFTFYPNPTKNQIIIKSQLAQNLSIYNMHGKEVFKAQVQNGIVVDLSQFAAGVYVIRNDLSESYRLIKN